MIAVAVQVFDGMVMSGFQSCVVVVVTTIMCLWPVGPTF